MAVTRLERKGRKNKAVAKKRISRIKLLNQLPPVKNIDIEAIKAEFEAKKSKPAKKAEPKAKKEEAPVEAAPEVEAKEVKEAKPKKKAPAKKPAAKKEDKKED